MAMIIAGHFSAASQQARRSDAEHCWAVVLSESVQALEACYRGLLNVGIAAANHIALTWELLPVSEKAPCWAPMGDELGVVYSDP